MKSLFVVLSILGCATSYAETREFDAKTINKVAVENSAGKTTITATETEKATVEINRTKFSDKCELEIGQKGSILNIAVKKKGMFNFDNCEVNFDIKVPKTADLNLTVGSGKVAVEKMQGELLFIIGSGNIVANGDFKKVEGMAGSGQIDIKGLNVGADLQTGSGSINLTYASATPKGQLAMSTGSGDAVVNFPKNTMIETAFEAGSGKLKSDLVSNPKADFKVSMKAGSGDLKIKTF
jgi:DUF4097 and DUF4098 domain-containing protein YvlB